MKLASVRLLLRCRTRAPAPAFVAAALCAWGLATPAAHAEPPPAEALARALALATEAATALAPAGARVKVEPGQLDPRLNLAPCARIEPYLGGGQPVWGRTRIGLRCTDGQARWNIFLPVTVQVWAPALVSTVSLPSGARLDESQLARTETDWAAAPQSPFVQASDLTGRTLSRAVVAGQAVRPADLQPRQWFTLGETVQIIAAGSGFSINAEGQALTPGLEGQPARVRTENGRVLVGRPVGERRIEVSL